MIVLLPINLTGKIVEQAVVSVNLRVARDFSGIRAYCIIFCG
jgi:hypothetical protein